MQHASGGLYVIRDTLRVIGREQQNRLRVAARVGQEIRLWPLTPRGSLLALRPNRVAHSYLHAVPYFLIALQLIVALGILNVWLLRPGKATPFRGGEAKNLREEFAAYGLPFWFHGVAQPAAIGLGALMLGAFVMHLKVKDPIKKALPSIAVLAMSAAIALL